MLRFTDQPTSEKIDFTLSHPTGYLDDEISETLADALKSLALALGRARAATTEGLADPDKAVREALLGFGVLAFNETRAFLIVAGAGLDRHARVHFRSVMEYEFRLRCILEDPSRAIAFFDAFAHELRKVANDLELQDEDAIENEIVAVLGKSQANVNSRSEKRAIFGKSGDVKSAMAELPDGQRRYVGTFSWPSQVSHGSVMALRDIAFATEGVGSAFLDVAGHDGYGNRLAYNIIWPILHLTNAITVRFMNGILGTIEALSERALAINKRLIIVSEEQEQRYAYLIENRNARKSQI